MLTSTLNHAFTQPGEGRRISHENFNTPIIFKIIREFMKN